MRTALSIAGSDSVGGAGIQADVRAMTAVGVHPATVVTAVTAQSTCAVKGVHPVPPGMVGLQLETVLEDCDVRAAKTGMLHSAAVAETVSGILAGRGIPLIADPVMVATAGGRLAEESLLRALKEGLLPLCELVTPNRFEAEALSGIRITGRGTALEACAEIARCGPAVLLTGGHFEGGTVVDHLYLDGEVVEIANPRLAGSGHGSGCTLSAYITAYRALGDDLVTAVLRARELMQTAIAANYRIGRGEPVAGSHVLPPERRG